ncbi:hypothetical protein ACE41H_24965 [Paenibacillus enshidis]|uniref:DNA2/NAM7 helicase-like C-terminal domain-containing protein n=1 Tax=Paenibacillus enshidis TaxID=1458439 RepID=A0ABV5B182_9BACL
MDWLPRPDGWLKNAGDVALAHRNDGSIQCGIFIKGDFLNEKARNPLTNYMLRLAFVAISRPTHLVGVAFHEDFLSVDERNELKSKGWIITVC